MQLAILREVCPRHFVTHNFMGLFDKPDYFDLARDLDFVSHDQYPIGFWTEAGALPDHADLAIKLDFVRGLKRRTFWIMEQQAGPAGWDLVGPTPRPGQLRLWAAQSVAHGADTVVYFRWRTCLFGTEEYWHGILQHDGKPGRRYAEVKRTVADLAPVMEKVKGQVPAAEAAILFSYDQAWANQIQPHHPELRYREHLGGFYRALHAANVPVDFVSPGTDLGAYRLVVAPMLFLTRPELVAQLTAYVAAGGTLVVTLRSGVKDWDNKALPETLPGPFASLLGIEVPDYDCLRSVSQGARWSAPGFGAGGAGAGAASEPVAKWADIIELKGAQALAVYTEDYYKGTPTITRHTHGKGAAVYVAAELGPRMTGELMARLAADAGVRGLLATPGGVEAVRRPGADGDYTFLMNHTAVEARVTPPAGASAVVGPAPGLDGTMTLPPYEIAVYRSVG
jgi:beta-galactosidase